MQPNYKHPFSRFVKKAHKPLQLAIEDAVEEICKNPKIGQKKVGDLAGIWIYKFKFNLDILSGLNPLSLPTSAE